MSAPRSDPRIVVKNLTMAYGQHIIMKEMNFEVRRGEILVVMGGSGCGKSTLMKHLVGLIEPASGEIFFGERNFTTADEEERHEIRRTFGVLYQAGALWGSMTLTENIALPLEHYTSLSASEIREVASFKLALVGLNGFEDHYPAEISGGMRKRAALARAMAIDPDILFFDEPSAGLDPISSARLDELIVQLRDGLGVTVVMVTHELASIFAIGDRCLYLDVVSRRITSQGPPNELANSSSDERVRELLTSRAGADYGSPKS